MVAFISQRIILVFFVFFYLTIIYNAIFFVFISDNGCVQLLLSGISCFPPLSCHSHMHSTETTSLADNINPNLDFDTVSLLSLFSARVECVSCQSSTTHRK